MKVDAPAPEALWPLLAEAIDGLKPDFVGVQEVFRPEDLEEVKKAGSFASSFTPVHKTGLGLLTQGEIEGSWSAILPPSPLEEAEKLEQMRFLENGIPIHVAETAQDTIGVDTEEDWIAASRLFESRSRSFRE